VQTLRLLRLDPELVGPRGDILQQQGPVIFGPTGGGDLAILSDQFEGEG